MISVIIPVLNEQAALPGTLGTVLGQQGEFEVIVVDGGSQDGTVEFVRSHPELRLLESARGRARQMNTGAAAARGDWLLFLHADTHLPAGALASVVALERDPVVLAGGFRHRFSGENLRLRIISWINNKRCMRTRVIYGDQAPFVRRELFLSLGGYPEEPVLEDVLFMERLNTVTRPVFLPKYVVTDSRRFVGQGILRSFSRVFLILICHRFGWRIPNTRFFAEVR